MYVIPDTCRNSFTWKQSLIYDDTSKSKCKRTKKSLKNIKIHIVFHKTIPISFLKHCCIVILLSTNPDFQKSLVTCFILWVFGH